MARYLLLARDDGSKWGELSPDQMQAVIQKYQEWSASIEEAGVRRASDKLADSEGRVLALRGNEVVVSDGPFVDTKEVIGGYWILEADDYDTLVALCEKHPHLEFGSLELRRIEDLG